MRCIKFDRAVHNNSGVKNMQKKQEKTRDQIRDVPVPPIQAADLKDVVRNPPKEKLVNLDDTIIFGNWL